jgi:hypothetical protein
MDRDAIAELLRVTGDETAARTVEAYRDVTDRDTLVTQDRPFAHPFHWAAFTYYGAERLELEDPPDIPMHAHHAMHFLIAADGARAVRTGEVRTSPTRL